MLVWKTILETFNTADTWLDTVSYKICNNKNRMVLSVALYLNTKKEPFGSFKIGGPKATTFELLIHKYIKALKTPEMFEIIRSIDYINNKRAA